MLETTFADAELRLATLCDEVTDNDEIVIFSRGAERFALISAKQLESLLETAHLMASPVNARRLISSLESALRGEGEVTTAEDLRLELGLDVICNLEKSLEQEQEGRSSEPTEDEADD
jgi:antitoxin YefM